MGAVEPVARRKLSHDVLERLLARISSGQIRQGELLPSERQLMDSYRVGRPAVREALQELQRMGLVVITQGEGARLVAPTARSVLDQIAGTARHILTTSPGSLDHLKEARLFFELGVVRQAAAKAVPADIAALRACIEDQRSGSKDFNTFLEADIAFHRTIAATLKNPIFVAVSEAMLSWMAEYHVGVIRKVGREAQTLSEHELIADRIEAHDVDGAAAAMLIHLTRAHDLYETPSPVDGPRA